VGQTQGEGEEPRRKALNIAGEKTPPGKNAAIHPLSRANYGEAKEESRINDGRPEPKALLTWASEKIHKSFQISRHNVMSLPWGILKTRCP
jgi:hypothetical protein